VPEKTKKPRKSKKRSVEQRVYRHYKALKRGSPIEFVPTSKCEGCIWSSWPHWHGYNKIVTSNSDWMILARTHGLTVREVKDIVSARRKWTQRAAIQVQENVRTLREDNNRSGD
jgi:hypothetical protein